MAAEEAEKIAATEENPKKRKMGTETEATRSNLPEDLWENIFKFLNDEENNTFKLLRPNGNLGFADHPRRIKSLYHVSEQDMPITNSSFRSLSFVSKQFLSITNRLRFLVKISEATIPFLSRLFERFPNITSLNITLTSNAWSREAHLGEFLAKISASPLNLKSLTLYHAVRVPENELRALSEKMKSLTSLACYQMRFINKNDLFLIADCFPLLEELILTDTGCPHNCAIDSDDQFLALPKLRRIALTSNIVGGHSIKNLCKSCDLLQEVKVVGGRVARYAFRGPRPPLQYQ
ncbi:putative leucine-rich repeat domain, L domain-containing protein [Medicago truncatula]|uniref:Putative leucine-rich repeat domain, L domain-containing protein n=1 Tax=Medicago truncatula TaxID=3880 RepID=A0A396HZR4_MEDTR|nr:putative leucine-rich repeat domain, L domain-containing protein [Medicago truncatula]